MNLLSRWGKTHSSRYFKYLFWFPEIFQRKTHYTFSAKHIFVAILENHIRTERNAAEVNFFCMAKPLVSSKNIKFRFLSSIYFWLWYECISTIGMHTYIDSNCTFLHHRQWHRLYLYHQFPPLFTKNTRFYRLFVFMMMNVCSIFGSLRVAFSLSLSSSLEEVFIECRSFILNSNSKNYSTKFINYL